MLFRKKRAILCLKEKTHTLTLVSLFFYSLINIKKKWRLITFFAEKERNCWERNKKKRKDVKRSQMRKITELWLPTREMLGAAGRDHENLQKQTFTKGYPNEWEGLGHAPFEVIPIKPFFKNSNFVCSKMLGLILSFWSNPNKSKS